MSGAASGNTSSKVVPEESEEQTRSAVGRKLHSSRVHQQPGKNSILSGDNVGERALDVVPGERNTNLCTVSPGRGEYQSRHRIPSDERLLGLDAKPSTVPTDTASVSRCQCRSVCALPDLPAPVFLQLETGSSSGGNRCLPAELEGTEGVREPSLESHRAGADESRESSCRSGAGGTKSGPLSLGTTSC